ncbi:MAG: porin [Microscillaceae bacterium]|jgi:hypothetical protein|nr:porin [Microscillaceae bacterium]
MKKHFLLICLLGLGLGSNLWAQGSETYGKGLRINLNEDGSKYIRFITWHQFWTRMIENNPGTAVNGEVQKTTFDVGLRRSRFLWYAQISPKFLILTHIGINNQTFVNGGASGSAGTGGYGVGKKPQLFIHDMWTEYAIVKDKLSIGTGLHYWNGISRQANASTLNFLAVDAPIFNWPLIEESDQFARQFGIYAKGKLGKIDYRIALNKPFATPGDTAVMNRNLGRAYSSNNNNWAFAGYTAYEFFDKESNVLPFTVGTYVGTKKILTLGFGWHIHPNATALREVRDGETKKHDMRLFGLDLFMDLPMNKDKGTAFTLYSVYYNYNFGPNYMRSIGIMNEGVPLKTGSLPQGGGNAQFHIGTGSIFYTEAGYLLPKSLLGKAGKIQPIGTLTYKNFEYLADPSLQYGVGFNYFMDGHHAKISLKYQNRPLYAAPLPGEKAFRNPDKKSAGELILQTMIYL